MDEVVELFSKRYFLEGLEFDLVLGLGDSSVVVLEFVPVLECFALLRVGDFLKELGAE